jgi:hypothetical protein
MRQDKCGALKFRDSLVQAVADHIVAGEILRQVTLMIACQ